MGDRLWVIGLVVLLVSCTGQGPQRPSQRKSAVQQPDTTLVALMELNQRMAQAADEQLLHIVQSQDTAFALYERGTWAYILDPGDVTREAITPGAQCTIHMRVYALNGKLYWDTQQTAQAGKYVFIPAIDENITEWHYGARIVLYAPWYAAFGITGKDAIPPYENVRIELVIK